MEAVNHSNSAEVSKATLETAAEAISKYLDRFQTVLAGRNLYYVQLLSSVILKLKSYLLKAEREKEKTKAQAASSASTGAAGESKANAGAQDTSATLMSVNDFIFDAKLDKVNLFKLRRHTLETNLIGRVGGFCEAAAKRAAAAAVAVASTHVSTFSKFRQGADPQAPLDGPSTPYSNALRGVFGLLSCLTNAEKDGRVVLSCQNSSEEHKGTPKGESVLRFLLLNPSAHFKALANEARSVVLLGGTLQPFDYLASSLFISSKTPPRDMRFFSCGHVVDRSNVATIVVDKGLNGGSLEFTHKSKFKKELVEDLLLTLASIARTVPNGIVAFFTSYNYMDWLVADWRRKGLLDSLAKQKEIFVEPRGVAEAEAVWSGYSKAATRSGLGSRGAILLCVMGGKLSEGINFSNALARAVVVVGMPFPDSRDPVLQEKLKQAERLDQQVNRISSSSSSSLSSSSTAGAASKKLYESMCMNSVNQSIGRSIRHAGDYAAILLMDRRFRQERVTAQLPMWIRNSLREANTLSAATDILSAFYHAKASK